MSKQIDVNKPDPGGEVVRELLAHIERLEAERTELQTEVAACEARIDALEREIEALQRDAEFGRSVLAKQEPGKAYGCHCDLEEGMEPDGCVIDSGERHLCIYAKSISVKEQCEYWRIITTDAVMSKEGK